VIAPVVPDPASTSPLCFLTLACSPLQALGGNVARDAASAVFGVFESGLGHAASWMVTKIGATLQGTTDIKLGSPWLQRGEEHMAGLMTIAVGPMLMAATLGAVVRQDARRLARIWLAGLPFAALATMLAVPLTALALRISDGLTGDFIGRSGAEVAGKLGAAVAGGAGTGSGVIAVLLSVLVILGALALWFELTLRAAAVYIAVFFLPLALAGVVWPATAHMTKRLVELLAALVFSKFVIAAVLSIGATALQSGGTDAKLQGGAMLLLAAFAPFALLRLVPIVEAAAVAHLEGLGQRPLQVGSRAVAAVAGPDSRVVALLRSQAAGEAASNGAPPAGEPVSAVTPPLMRGEPADWEEE
jgi:hypothetical protein